ncbi:MAG TPA: hypothetical protein VGL23_13275 [Chloroflexota bacterium]|jgi:hypothetical protein
MQFNVSRRPGQTAAALKACTLCGAPLPVADGAARPVQALCASCSRPVRLGAPRREATGQPLGNRRLF